MMVINPNKPNHAQYTNQARVPVHKMTDREIAEETLLILRQLQDAQK